MSLKKKASFESLISILSSDLVLGMCLRLEDWAWRIGILVGSKYAYDSNSNLNLDLDLNSKYMYMYVYTIRRNRPFPSRYGTVLYNSTSNQYYCTMYTATGTHTLMHKVLILALILHVVHINIQARSSVGALRRRSSRRSRCTNVQH